MLANTGRVDEPDTRTIVESLRDMAFAVHCDCGETTCTDNALTVMLDMAADDIERLSLAVDTLARRSVSLDGRYIVLCDDGSVIATDDLEDGDNVLVDRGEDW